MVRPRKFRRVCELPENDTFGPVGNIDPFKGEVTMSVEAFEVIRMMDLVGLTQDQAAEMMGVARSTVQRIYDEARKSLAESLVNGKVLKIQGGCYKLCADYSDEEKMPCEPQSCCQKKDGPRCCQK